MNLWTHLSTKEQSSMQVSILTPHLTNSPWKVNIPTRDLSIPRKDQSYPSLSPRLPPYARKEHSEHLIWTTNSPMSLIWITVSCTSLRMTDLLQRIRPIYSCMNLSIRSSMIMRKNVRMWISLPWTNTELIGVNKRQSLKSEVNYSHPAWFISIDMWEMWSVMLEVTTLMNTDI